MSKFTILIHGGAGTILKSEITAKQEANYKNALEVALACGYLVLENGGSALDAVRAAVVSLEDIDLFNAGKGSVFASDGSQEMDAAIMDGKTLDAGAVAAVRNIRNPIELAFAVMTQSDHVLLNGRGAEDFARVHNIKSEPDDYFFQHSDLRN